MGKEVTRAWHCCQHCLAMTDSELANDSLQQGIQRGNAGMQLPVYKVDRLYMHTG